jgi:hypothetical protein
MLVGRRHSCAGNPFEMPVPHDQPAAAAYTRTSVESYLQAAAADRVRIELATMDVQSRTVRARADEARLLAGDDEDGATRHVSTPVTDAASTEQRPPRTGRPADAAGSGPPPASAAVHTGTRAERTTVHGTSATAPVSDVVPGDVVRQLVARNEWELAELERRFEAAEQEAEEAERRLATAVDAQASVERRTDGPADRGAQPAAST